MTYINTPRRKCISLQYTEAHAGTRRGTRAGLAPGSWRGWSQPALSPLHGAEGFNLLTQTHTAFQGLG